MPAHAAPPLGSQCAAQLGQNAVASSLARILQLVGPEREQLDNGGSAIVIGMPRRGRPDAGGGLYLRVSAISAATARIRHAPSFNSDESMSCLLRAGIGPALPMPARGRAPLTKTLLIPRRSPIQYYAIANYVQSAMIKNSFLFIE
jgi:hypothetical protein